MRTGRYLTVIAIALWPCATVAWWPPDNTQDELGLPMTTEGGLEIRVWLGAGVVRPYDLFRIRQSSEKVTGELIAWSEVTQPQESLYTPKEARRENASMRRLLQTDYCASEIRESPVVMWCPAKTKHQPNWPILLDDLMPEELWKLPETVKRDCGWRRLDGETITIELIQGSRYHSITYDNPDYCCTDVACAIANHVRYVLTHNAM